MSGHNKWANIKVRKEAMDKNAKHLAKWLNLLKFPRARVVTLSLTLLAHGIDKARSYNMPNDNIQRAIKRFGRR